MIPAVRRLLLLMALAVLSLAKHVDDEALDVQELALLTLKSSRNSITVRLILPIKLVGHKEGCRPAVMSNHVEPAPAPWNVPFTR
jgi:hypothetical protein